MEEIKKECEEVVKRVCEKFGYNSEDKYKCESMQTVLQKVVFAMCKNSKPEDRNLLYQALENTPIVVTEEEMDKDKYKRLVSEYIGNPNPHIAEVDETKLNVYGEQVGKGAYVSEPVLDEDLNIVGKKSFIYVPKAQGKAKDFFGTDIDVSYLIHELGHAWHSQENEFTITQNGMLKQRVGTANLIYSFAKADDGKTTQKLESSKGLMIEEGMNTVDEENYMADYLGISVDEMIEAYSSILVPNTYQGYIAEFVRYMLEELGKDEFERWRIEGDLQSKDKIEGLMKRTRYWENRENNVNGASDSQVSYEDKRAIIESSKSKETSIQEFFSNNQSLYFPEVSQMEPLEKIDNALEQYYSLKASMLFLKMGIDDYSQLIKHITNESYPLVNQASLIKLKDQLKSVVGKVGMYDLNAIAQKIHTMEQVVGKNERGE